MSYIPNFQPVLWSSAAVATMKSKQTTMEKRLENINIIAKW